VIHELRGTPEPLELSLGESGHHFMAATPISPRANLPTEQALLPARRRRAVAWSLVGGLALLTAGGAYQLQRAQPQRTPLGGVGSGPLVPIDAPSPPTSAAPVAALAVSPIGGRTGTLVVRVDASGARLFVDGRAVPLDVRSARIELAAAEHELSLGAPGRKRIARRVRIEPGATLELDLPLARETRGDRSSDPDYLVDDGRRDAQVATALFVVGGIAAGVGVVLAIVAARKGARRALARTPLVGPGAMGGSCAL